jgi:hypothetical protein
LPCNLDPFLGELAQEGMGQFWAAHNAPSLPLRQLLHSMSFCSCLLS